MSLVVWMPLNGDVNNQGVGKLNYISGTPVYVNDGKLGKCLDLSVNPTLSFSCDELNGLDGSNITIAFWVNVLTGDTSLGDWRRIVFLGDANSSGTSGSGFRFEACFNSSLRACSTHNNTTNNIWSASHLIIPNDMKNQWHHVCVTMDGSSIKSYRDGVLVAESTSGKGAGHFNGIIQFGHGGAMRGKLNDFRIYDRALSLQEIKILSQCLLLHYPMTGGGRGQDNKFRAMVALGQGNCQTDSRACGYVIKLPSTTGLAIFQSKNLVDNGVFSSSDYGKTFTISFTAWANKDTNLRCDIYPDTYGNSLGLPNDHTATNVFTTPKRLVYSGALTNTSGGLVSGTSLRFWHYGSGTSGMNDADIYITDIKIEIGSKSTTYTLNPNDANYSAMGYNDNTEYDTSGYLHNGTINGNVSYSSDSARYSVSTEFSKAGYVNVPSFNVDTSAFTLNFWVKMKTATSQHFVLGTFTSWTGNGIGVYRDANAEWYSCVIRSAGESTYKQFSLYPTIGSWYMLTLTYDGTNYKGYLNGVLKQNVTCSSGGVVSNPVFMVGNSKFNSTPSSENEEAFVSDVRFYATALSAEDIQKLYNTSASIANNGVLMSYEFAET